MCSTKYFAIQTGSSVSSEGLLERSIVNAGVHEADHPAAMGSFSPAAFYHAMPVFDLRKYSRLGFSKNPTPIEIQLSYAPLKISVLAAMSVPGPFLGFSTSMEI